MRGAARTIERIRSVARDCGYAVGVHGSQERDLDLIAVPWVDDADSPEQLLVALNEAENIIYGPPNPQPHGRVGYVLHGFPGCEYVDLSIMPLTRFGSIEEIERAFFPDLYKRNHPPVDPHPEAEDHTDRGQPPPSWPKTLVHRGERLGSTRPDYVWWQELPEDATAAGLRSVGYEVVEVRPTSHSDVLEEERDELLRAVRADHRAKAAIGGSPCCCKWCALDQYQAGGESDG